MNEPFLLHLTYCGKEYELPARFERWGYTHRFAVMIEDVTYLFEPDEEGSYRVLSETIEALTTSAGLLQAVAGKLAILLTT